jgi:hypothetical protein
VAVLRPHRLSDLACHRGPVQVHLHGHLQVDLSCARAAVGRKLFPRRWSRRAGGRGLCPDRPDRGRPRNAAGGRADGRRRRCARLADRHAGRHRRDRCSRGRDGHRRRRRSGRGLPGLCLRHLVVHDDHDPATGFRAGCLGAVFLGDGAGCLVERGWAVGRRCGDRASAVDAPCGAPTRGAVRKTRASRCRRCWPNSRRRP